ncbi:hypothetical protein I2486_12120 [Cellulophaga sp. E16_2]|uniref:hypothetical protein n=1 Tax=Cellulophaga sp. E16_2 TaxID=2789297 RepID=UPI001A937B8E|nr:hypothetical protein [Cellulophaga sp. E16_2]MBO0592149.1 hypothetical protein [Cellulophaga sp. E16_2]
MKKVLKFTAIAALVFSTFTASASELKLNVAADKEAKSLIFELDIVSKDTKIQFLDSKNNVIYSNSNLKSSSLRKKFDLSKLEKGVYTFRVDDMTLVTTYAILIDGESIRILNKDEVIKPVFRMKDGMIFVNLLNVDKMDVEIKVYDSNDRVLFTQKISDTLIVEKAVNFKTAHKGDYTITVKNANGVYRQNVSI